MTEKTIVKELYEAMDKHATLVLASGDRDSMIQKNTEVDRIPAQGISLQRLKEIFLLLGEVLDEDVKSNVITAVVPTGHMNASRAFVVARIENDVVNIAVFFKEGLIKQHGAKKVIDSVRRQING